MRFLGRIMVWPLLVGYRFWTYPVRAEPLALFRILLGVCLLLNLWLTILPFANDFVGEDPLCPTEALDPYLKRTGTICLLRGENSIPFREMLLPLPASWTRAWDDWGSTSTGAFTLFGLFTASTLSMTVGLATRISTFVSWVLALTMYQRLLWIMNGGDEVARMALFYLLFAQSGAVWSVDSWLKRHRSETVAVPEPPLIPAWPLRLMQIQFCLIYLFSGLAKLTYKFLTPQWSDNDWLSGEALYWLYNDVELVRWPYHWTPFPLWFCRLQTWAVLGFELGFSFLILFRLTRPWTLLFGVLMHLGIWLHTEIAFFSPYMLCWYVLFLPGDRLARLFGWRRITPHQQNEPAPGCRLGIPI